MPVGNQTRAFANRRSSGVLDHCYNMNPMNFLKWKKALTQVRLGIADAKILVIGDSFSSGHGSSLNSTNIVRSSYGWRMADMFTKQGFADAAPGLAPPLATVQPDTRWAGWATLPTVNIAWAPGTVKTCRYTNVTNAVLTFTPGVMCDGFEVYHLTPMTNTRAFSMTATGGTPVNIAAGSGGTNWAISKTTVMAGSLADTNVLTIDAGAASGALGVVFAAEPFISTKRQVRIGSVAISGQSAQGWDMVSTDPTLVNVSPKKMIENYAPSLTIFNIGSNDVGNESRTTAQMMTNLNSLIASAKVTGDVLLWSPVTVGPVDWPLYASGIAGNVQAMQASGYPLVDLWTRTGGASNFAAYNAAGYMYSDKLHLNDYGAADVAQSIFTALRTVSG